MPYVFQKEIEKNCPYYTGCEKFDSLYRLYDIFQDPSYFLINLFFGEQENLTQKDIASFLKLTAKEYMLSNFVVRCEKKTETTPVEAVAFSNINLEEICKNAATIYTNR